MKRLKNINYKLLFISCLIAAICSTLTSFSLIHIFKDDKNLIALEGTLSEEPNIYDPDTIKYDASNAVKAPDGIMIYQELKVESGDLIPNIDNYFQDDISLSENAYISYYIGDKIINVGDFTYRDERRTYTKGTHEIDVIISVEETDYKSKLIIYDDKNPIVSFKDLTITKGDKINAKKFIEAYTDNSKDTNYTVKINNKADYTSVGEHTISLTVCDKSDNCVNGSAKLTVKAKKPSGGSSGGNSNNSGNGSGNSHSGSQSNNNNNSKRTGRDTPVLDPNVRYVKVSEAKEAYKDYAETRTTILNKTNEYRKEVGSNPLKLDYDLCIIAMVRAMEMAYNNDFSHVRPDGTPWYNVYYSYYGVSKNTVAIAENIAVGYKTDNGVMNGWRYSEGHYRSMINTAYKTIGIGKYTYNDITFWVQIFSA